MSWQDWFAALPERLQRHPSDGDLVACLDGELPPRRERRVRSHVDGCRPCRERMEKMAAILDGLRDVVPAPDPGDEIRLGRQRLELAIGAREAEAPATPLQQRFLGRLAADPVHAAETGVVLRTLLGFRAAAWAVQSPGAGREGA
jgi:anti-sigma factor RsiW